MTLTASNPLPPGVPVNLPLNIHVNSNVEPGSSVQFNATVGAQTPDNNLANNHANADTSVIAKADLALTKSGPAMSNAGQPITYTLVVTNHGPSMAHFVDVKDALPVGVTLNQATVKRSGSGNAACAGAVCEVGNMALHEVITITVVGTVAPGLANETQFTNTATVFANTPDPIPANNVASWMTTVKVLARLRINKRDLIDPITPGAVLAYVIEVTNDGPSNANDVTVTDHLPDGVTYMGDTAHCNEAPAGTLNCPLGTLAVGVTRNFQVFVLVKDTNVNGTTLHNTATVTSTTLLLDSVLTSSADTLVQQFLGPPADLAISKRASSAAVMTNHLITYTLVITNYGPATATDVKMIDPLPSGLTLVRVTASQGLCDNGVACLLGTLPYNGTPRTARITLVARADANVPQGTILNNTALVQGSQPDPNESNNASSVPVEVSTAADLVVKKTGAPNPAIAGQQLLYTIVITNNGPADAVSVVITDLLPSGFTNVTFNPSQGGCDGVSICHLGDLAVKGKATISVVGIIAPGITGSIANTVLVGSNTHDPDLSNNQSTVSIPVSGNADLDVKVTSSPTVFGGETAAVTVTVFNHGPSAAFGTVVTVTLPPGTSLNHTALPPGWTAIDHGNGLVTIITSEPIMPGVPINLPLTVNMSSDFEPGSSHQFDAQISSNTAETNSFNNNANADTSTVGEADVEVKKVASANPVAAGDTLIYTITVNNHGPSLAQDVDVKDFLPAGVTLQQLSTSQGACISNICQLGRIPVTDTVIITAVTKVDPNLKPGTALNNQATAFTDSRDPDNANNTAAVTVLVGPVADLRINKVADRTVVKPNNQVVYTIAITNSGPSNAPNVVVTDTLPPGILYIGNTAGCQQITQGVITCNLGLIPANQTTQVNLLTLVDTTAISGTLTNIAKVGSNNLFDPDQAANTSTAPIQVINLPTAIELLRFIGTPLAEGNVIDWTTAIELDTAGFHLLRSQDGDQSHAVRITPDLIRATGSVDGNSYTFVDKDVEVGVRYAYWLEEVLDDGTTNITGPLYVVFIPPGTGYAIFLPLVSR